MNFGLVARVLGNLLLIEGAILAVPPASPCLFVRGAGFRFSAVHGYSGTDRTVSLNIPAIAAQNQEAMVIVTVGWVVTALFAALPLCYRGLCPLCVREAVSGLTTTGLPPS